MTGTLRWASPTATPKTVIAAPQAAMHHSTAAPVRRTRDTQPLKTPPTTAPAGMAANSRANASPPSVGPPKSRLAICGNSARGMPKIMAMRSTTKDMSRIGCRRR